VSTPGQMANFDPGIVSAKAVRLESDDQSRVDSSWPGAVARIATPRIEGFSAAARWRRSNLRTPPRSSCTALAPPEFGMARPTACFGYFG
jgi:hypothetical protein